MNIPGATSGTYTITNAQVSQAGMYTVLVSFDDSSVVSFPAVLSVTPPSVHFDVSLTGVTQTTGVPIPVNVTARDSSGNIVTDFSDTVSFSINASESVSASLLGLQTHNGVANAFIGTTLGYSFTPGQDLLVTRVRHHFGTKVSLWTEAGALLASQNVTSTPGSWVETPLAAPVALTADTSYRVGVFVPAGSAYFWRVMPPSAPPFGSAGSPYWTLADAFPAMLNSSRWPMVDLQFTAQSLTPIAVAPSMSGTFTQGVWTGTLTTLDTGTNAVLQASSGGRSGASGEFNITLGLPVITDHPADARRIAGKDLLLSATAIGGGTLAYQWWFNGAAVPEGNTPQLSLNNLTAEQAGAYWCSVANAAGAATSCVARVAVGTAILSHATPPDLQSIRSTGFELSLQMELGRSYRIEGSTNLMNWVTITNFVSNGGAMQFLDRSATNLTKRFYRVVRQ